MRRLITKCFAAAAFGLAALAPLAAAPKSGSRLLLAGDGLVIDGKAAKFRVTTKAQAVAMVVALQGRPTEQGSHGDCGQGDVISFAKFRGGFELSFVGGRLSGWTADGAAPKTTKGIGVGATLTAVRKAYPQAEADPGDEANGGLGPSFAQDGGPNGWIDGTKPGSKVTGLYAGATCLAGI